MRLRISADDATVEDFLIADFMHKYGLEKQAIYYWPVMPRITNEPKGRISLTDEQMQEIAKDSEIGSHTISHRLLTRIPSLSAKDEISRSRAILQNKFQQEIKSLSWPRGYTNPTLQQFAQEAGYETARGVTVGYFYDSENPYDLKTTLHAGYDRKEYGGKDWFTYGQYMLEQAKDIEDSTFSLMLHSWELSKYPRGFEKFEVLLRQLAEVAHG